MKIGEVVRGWFNVRVIRDPEKIARRLGRPERLELTNVQARMVEAFYVEERKDAAEVAKAFFKHWARDDFPYFLALNNTGIKLERTAGDAALDGVELIEAAMRELGALVQHEGSPDWFLQTAHPMARRLAESAAENYKALVERETKSSIFDGIGVN